MPKIGKYWLSLDHYYWAKDTAHTWAKIKSEPAKVVRVGIDDFAQKQAGELKFMRLFPVGTEVKQGARFGTLETDQVGEAAAVPGKRESSPGEE
jgi:glycine cleavage system H lipoate-binding protein